MIHSFKYTFALIISICLLSGLNSCKKKSAPPILSTNDVTDVTPTTASAGGTITSEGDDGVELRGICWSASINPTNSDNIITGGSGIGSFTSTITGLNPGTVYHARAFATNSSGTSYGSDRLFITIKIISASDSSKIKVSAIISGSASGTTPAVSSSTPPPATSGSSSGSTTPASTTTGSSSSATGTPTASGGTVAGSISGGSTVPSTGNSSGSSTGSNVSGTSGSGNGSINNSPANIIEGKVFENSSSNWSGVNIPRSTPLNLIFRNNSVTSMNSAGYLLQAGDESPGATNNKLDGESITGNKFVWNGTDMASSITHGIFCGYNINCNIKYNYLLRVPTGMVLKSNGMTYTSGGVAYNIISNSGDIAVAIKGTNEVLVYNNTFYSNEVKYTSNSNPGTAYGIVDIFANDGLSPKVYAKGAKIKNNIFYTVHQISNITVEDSQDLEGFESDYNVFWCEAGTPVFSYLGSEKTFSQWQALGYDTHSIVVNPKFNNLTDFVPASRLDYGSDLGSVWQEGLSTNASWALGSAPVTTNQNNHWQNGARLY